MFTLEKLGHSFPFFFFWLLIYLFISVTRFVSVMVMVTEWCLWIPWPQCTDKSQLLILRPSGLQILTVNYSLPTMKQLLLPSTPPTMRPCSPPPWGGICYKNMSPGSSMDSLLYPQLLVSVVWGICKDKKQQWNQDIMRVGRLMIKLVETNMHSTLRTEVSPQVSPPQLTHCETMGTTEPLWTAVSSPAGWGQPFPLCREAGIIQQDVDKNTF